jgi:hypothetical protein
VKPERASANDISLMIGGCRTCGMPEARMSRLHTELDWYLESLMACEGADHYRNSVEGHAIFAPFRDSWTELYRLGLMHFLSSGTLRTAARSLQSVSILHRDRGAL